MESLDCLTRDCINLLKKNKLLKTLIKIELTKNVLQDVAIEKEKEDKVINNFKTNYGIEKDEGYQAWLKDNDFSDQEFRNLALYEMRHKKYCKENFDNKVGARFLERKNDLDIIVYSLIRTRDFNKAKEIYLRILEKEADLGDLASQFSEGLESKTRGIVGPTQIGASHPKLAQVLRQSKPGEIQPPFEVDGSYLLVRVESFEPSKLDDFMREKMREELFNVWINDKVNHINEKLLKTNTSTNLNEN
ncbi:peptidylprolyl isomerase [Prochlorococcus marinus]|uniref:peptidylprolyl isomerase n=1 Tax=Prochlorococcus marinus TaxID=1219 RepID=UPI0022B2DF83|nr:peptidylprolyl isomerase [Prochlorococcus marinus]